MIKDVDDTNSEDGLLTTETSVRGESNVIMTSTYKCFEMFLTSFSQSE